ncbi:purine-cytosine permease family protein [Nocardioides pocheonensis]|uniref:Cytosine permease n=1 Tax=Nocardioides pocheonensis TaxID=661485 RepID=A0A3N0GHY0_9ACTN|nr:cytosine permease [Nocardioides pocheonensis]RNM12094.1 cytosine permease [Nocardioides pocheonensis]
MSHQTPNSLTSTDSTQLIEKRSIEYIPRRERHGKPWHVTPVWIACSANLTGIAIGSIGFFSGLNLLWSLVAIVLGSMFGTFFAAFHASQGPQLGIPQMIQSRPQYGYLGAVLIYLIAVATYLGINVFGIVLLAQGLNNLFHISLDTGMILTAVVGVALAVAGYDLVHKVSRWVTGAFVVALLLLVVAAPFVLDVPAGSGSFTQGFSMAGFMLQASAMAVATLSWAPYVSDYTRYLPHLSTKASFFGTYLGMAITGIVVAGIGAVVTAAFPKLDYVSGLTAAGDAVFGGFGHILLGVTLVGTAILICMNTYGGGLTVLSISDSFRPSTPGRFARPMVTGAFGLVSVLISFKASDQFVTNFANFLTILFYALAPWTATNLVDFFLVRRGRYSIREIFNPRGMYGSWNWRGYTAYGLSVAAMVPFAVTHWWSGPIGKHLGYDVAAFVGMAVSAGVYLVLSRSMDLDAERRQIELADANLEEWATTDVRNEAASAPFAQEALNP